MAKEIERAGIPVAHVCSIITAWKPKGFAGRGKRTAAEPVEESA
jgi:hypothetical protein